MKNKLPYIDKIMATKSKARVISTLNSEELRDYLDKKTDKEKKEIIKNLPDKLKVQCIYDVRLSKEEVNNIILELKDINAILELSPDHLKVWRQYGDAQVISENIDNYIQTKIDISIFNLGYLPVGDHKFTTKDDTTLKTIDKILNNLNINGYVAIVMYPGHEEGLKEYQSIKLFVKDLPKKSFTVGWYKMINHNFNAPALCWIEKVGEYA